MKKIINRVAFKIYNAGWSIAIPLLKKNHRISDGFQQRLLKQGQCSNADIWIQAASGGEAFLALELLKEIEFERKVKILLTSNTRQGIEILERAEEYTSDKNIDIQISFSPFDKPAIMKKAIEIINPKVMVLIELEMWPGLLKALKDNHCKTIIVNGRLTQKSLNGYLKWPSLWHEIAPLKILAISKEDAGRFKQLFKNTTVEVMNNIKFDRVLLKKPDAGESTDNPLIKIVDTERKSVVLGSVRAEEEEAVSLIITHLLKNNPETVIWLFPRHMHRIKDWQQLCDKLKISWSLRSEINNIKKTCDIILWDKFGELGFAYELTDAAFVGGSLAPLGGQNFLEVLATGLVPVTGPFWDNFIWAGEEIIKKGLLCLENDWEKVAKKLSQQLSQPQSREIIFEKMTEYLSIRQGGTQFACDHIKKMLQVN